MCVLFAPAGPGANVCFAADITKRLNATSPTARSPPRLLTEAGKQLGEMGPMRGGSPSSNGSSASDRGAVPQLFSRAFDDYEV